MFQRFSSSLACTAVIGAFAFAGAAKAASSVVAPGIYSNDSQDSARNGYRPPVQQPEPSGLGGGFIEMLVTSVNSGASGYPAPQPAAAPRQYALADRGQTQPRREVDPMYLRAEVDYSGAAPGTVVVDTNSKFLYYVKNGGRAIRYGIGVGRPGFEWSGVKTISRKAEWPDWTPPKEMLARRPDLPRFMPGGIENPLGARALYLGSSMYRIHGTNEPYTIGQNVSSGCIRMMNEDVTDLYNRVGVGTRVIVR